MKMKEKADWSMAEQWLGCPLMNRRYAMIDGEFRKFVANSNKEDALIDKEIRKASKKD